MIDVIRFIIITLITLYNFIVSFTNMIFITF